MDGKVQKGGWPSTAPCGYLNDAATRDVVVDEKRAPLVRRIFELCATGRYALEELVDIARKEGLDHSLRHRPMSEAASITF